MACSIKIKENLIANIEQRTNDVMNKDLFTANKRAQYINSIFGYKVVSFSQSEKDFINRSITVPEELVQKYYDNETLIEQEEARQIQSEDAQRLGEEYADNEYMFQLNNSENLGPAIKELDNYLLSYMKNFGVRSKEFDELKSKLDVDALGATDVLNKLIWYTKNRNSETIPEEVGHMATMLMGEKHPDIKDLKIDIVLALSPFL